MKNSFLSTSVLAFMMVATSLSAQNDSIDEPNIYSIKSHNGKLYAYIDLLFYNNLYFVNLIQPNSVSQAEAQNENLKVNAYQNYLRSIKDESLKATAALILDVYQNPTRYSRKRLDQIARSLENRYIVLRFQPLEGSPNTLILAYCIYGRKKLIEAKHPFFSFAEPVYNIIPFISYPEISNSNSTIHSDMIFINMEEVANDSLIAQRILQGRQVNSIFFNGARVNADIRLCIQKAFQGRESEIRRDITRIFEIHELTHKALSNQYNIQDLVLHEEFALSSTIYANPYLGLAFLYSYLDYDNLTQHKLAALNYIRFAANFTGKSSLIDNPGLMTRDFSAEEIRKFTKAHFDSMRQVFRMRP